MRRLQSDRRFRMREAMFVAEGERWLRDVASHGLQPAVTFVTTDALAVVDGLIDNPLLVSEAVMRSMSDVETPSGVLMVMAQPEWRPPQDGSLMLIADAIQTPGNLGTILRGAAAAGCSSVLLAPGCVDPFNPKVVRSGMGAHLRLPLFRMGWDEIVETVKEMNVVVASAETDTVYTAVDWTLPTALIVGNEANGPCEQARALGSGIRIPMAGDTESLNAAMAASIILFEAARQRNWAALRND